MAQITLFNNVLFLAQAQPYGTSTYGGGTYDCPTSQVCETTAPGVTTPSTGVYQANGLQPFVLIGGILLLAVVFATIVLVIKKLNRKKTAHHDS